MSHLHRWESNRTNLLEADQKASDLARLRIIIWLSERSFPCRNNLNGTYQHLPVKKLSQKISASSSESSSNIVVVVNGFGEICVSKRSQTEDDGGKTMFLTAELMLWL